MANVGSLRVAASIDEADVLLNDIYASSKRMEKQDNGEIPIYHKMISACLGSLITSLVVTPFDVLRIRMQQQELLPPEACCQTSELAQAKQKFTRNTLVKNSVISSPPPPPPIQQSSTGLWWVDRNYCKTGPYCSRITSTGQGFVVIAKNEGLPTLWRGLSLTLFMAVPSNIIYFTGYEYIRDHSFILDHPLNPLLCGALARTMSATFVAPLELMKTRLQSIPSDKSSTHMLKKLIHDLYSVMKTNGIRTLFTGLEITLWRDVPFSGIYWLSYEVLKSKIGRALKADFNSSMESKEEWRVFVTSFLSGSISGTIGAFFTNPFDVGKTRLQIVRESDSMVKRPSMFSFLLDIYKKEGIGALYAGFTPRVLKIAPACAIMISSYEIGKKFFKNSN